MTEKDIIRRFFLNKQQTGRDGFEVSRLPAVPKPTMEHFGWSYSTPMRMVLKPTGILIERDIVTEKEKK